MTTPTSRPHYCLDIAYDEFAAQLGDLDAEGALLRAAVAIAKHDMPEVKIEDVEDRLQNLANRVLARVRSDNPKALLSHAHAVLFDEIGYVGNAENYYDPANSYIPAVLEQKRGIPITLTLIYKEVLERIGLSVAGINAPGHFFANVWMDGKPMLVDPYMRGRVLTRDEACARIRELVGDIETSRDLLEPATNHGWIARMIQNLVVVFGQSRQQGSLAAMLELQGLLAQARDDR